MAMEESKVTKMKKFIFEEKFISYADVEIYAENEEDARRQFQNGNYQYYDVSDFTDGHELINVREETEWKHHTKSGQRKYLIHH